MRLEEVARALEHGDAPRHVAARLVEGASVATSNAVALELLTAERAELIWRSVAREHPVLARSGSAAPAPPVRLAS